MKKKIILGIVVLLALDALKQSLDAEDKTIILGENSPLAQILLNP